MSNVRLDAASDRDDHMRRDAHHKFPARSHAGSLRMARIRIEFEVNRCEIGERLTEKIVTANAGYQPQIAVQAITNPRTTIVKKSFVQPSGVDQCGMGTIRVVKGILNNKIV